jgi:hypothetical protein
MLASVCQKLLLFHLNAQYSINHWKAGFLTVRHQELKSPFWSEPPILDGANTLICHVFPTESSLIRIPGYASCRGDEGGPLPVWLPVGVAGRAEVQWRAVEQCVWEGVDSLFAAQFACLSDVYRRPFQDFFEKMGVLPTPPVSW